jgi:methyl-accepting chemotaxis protein/methyl-accepting chemotaxis protein-1 (serine sensor receptor)
VKTLSDEVSLGSQEQTRGMDQIAQAITQMEHVTQKTAASAEESASASEELSSHAKTMRAAATKLRAMVDSDASGSVQSAPKVNHRASPAPSVSKPTAAGPKKPVSRLPKSITALKSALSTPSAPSKKDEFPLDDGEFREF